MLAWGKGNDYSSRKRGKIHVLTEEIDRPSIITDDKSRRLGAIDVGMVTDGDLVTPWWTLTQREIQRSETMQPGFW